MDARAPREAPRTPRRDPRAGIGPVGTGAAANGDGVHHGQPAAARRPLTAGRTGARPQPGVGRWLRVAGWLALALFVAVTLGPRAAGHTPAVEPAASPPVPPIVRLHVVAHSDAARDQAVKLQVRDALLPLVTAAAAGVRTPEEVLQRVAAMAPQLEGRAEAVVRQAGLSYGARVEIGSFAFDRRELGGFVYPAGTYPAVRVVLGSGRGHNFWCVLFPGLCRVGDGGPAGTGADPATAVEPLGAVAAGASGTSARLATPVPGSGGEAASATPQALAGGAYAAPDGTAAGTADTAAVDPAGAGRPPETRWFLLEWWRGSVGSWWASLAAWQRAAAR